MYIYIYVCTIRVYYNNITFNRCTYAVDFELYIILHNIIYATYYSVYRVEYRVP